MKNVSNSGNKKQYTDEEPDSPGISKTPADEKVKNDFAGRPSLTESDKYMALFNSMREGFCILEVIYRNGKPSDILHREVNPAFERHLGMSGLAGRYLTQMFPGEAAFWIDKYAHLAGSAKPFGLIDYSRVLGKWFEVSAFRCGNPGENLMAVLINDITERRLAEENLLKSEMKYRNIVETANEGVCQTDKDLIIKYVNNKTLELSGYAYDELIGKPALKLISPDENYKLKRVLARLEKEKKSKFTFKLLRKEGKEIFVSVSASVVIDKSGNVEGYVGMITDITEATAIEKDLKRTRKKLENALIIGKIGTWDWNLRTNEMILDQRAEEIFSVKHRAFGGTMRHFETYIHDEDVHHFRDDIEWAMNNGQFESICRTKPRSGKSNYILSKAIVSRDKKNKPLGMSGISFDVTEMKEGTEKTLIRLNEALLRSNNDLQQFAYVASHDLQEPLRMVSSFTQLLQMRYAGKLDEDANEYISFAVNGSRRMYELINGLLAYSRIGTWGKEFQPVNIVNVVEKVKANMKLMIEETEATIIHNDLPVITADENQMIQLFQNLIENSLKFRKGKPVITITSTLRNDIHLFCVKDNGIGIESQYFEKIFRIFQRLHHMEYKGTGIGLAICQRIVERHAGRIWVNSKPGEGSTFSFAIPVR